MAPTTGYAAACQALRENKDDESFAEDDDDNEEDTMDLDEQEVEAEGMAGTKLGGLAMAAVQGDTNLPWTTTTIASRVQSVSDLAFNVSLVAYDFQYPDRTPKQRLVVKKLTKIKNVASLLATDGAGVPRITPSEAELVSTSDDQITGLWVGMRPSSALDYMRKSAGEKQDEEDREPEPKKRKAGSSFTTAAKKGSSVSKNSGYPKIEFDRDALRVIAPFGKYTANYYALVNQEHGLCTAYHLPIKEVFFFSEFRDDSLTSFHARLATWTRKVREACQIHKRVTWPRKNDKTESNVEPIRSLANEVTPFIATYPVGGHKSVLQSARDLIDNVEADKSLGPVLEDVMLHELLDGKRVLKMKECNLALSELLKLAPDIECLKIEVEEIQQMSRAISESQILLDFRLVRPFTVDFIRETRRNVGLDMSAVAIASREYVLLQLGQASTHAEKQIDTYPRLHRRRTR